MSELREINPRLIYAQFTGFGSVGPDRDKRVMTPQHGGRRRGSWTF